MAGLLEFMLTPFALIMARPFIALVTAALFAAMYWRLRGPTALTAANAWCVNGVYEYANDLPITRSGECNIRVDLLLVAPLLIGITVVALVSPTSPPARHARR